MIPNERGRRERDELKERKKLEVKRRLEADGGKL